MFVVVKFWEPTILYVTNCDKQLPNLFNNRVMCNAISTFTKKNVMLVSVSWDNGDGEGDAVRNVVGPQPCAFKWVNALASRNGRHWPYLLFSLREPSPECRTDAANRILRPSGGGRRWQRGIKANETHYTDETNLLGNLRTNCLRVNIKITRLSNTNN